MSLKRLWKWIVLTIYLDNVLGFYFNYRSNCVETISPFSLFFHIFDSIYHVRIWTRQSLNHTTTKNEVRRDNSCCAIDQARHSRKNVIFSLFFFYFIFFLDNINQNMVIRLGSIISICLTAILFCFVFLSFKFWNHPKYFVTWRTGQTKINNVTHEFFIFPTCITWWEN